MSKELEGALIIGALVLVLGAVLLVPGIWWARKARRDPQSFAGSKVNKSFIAGTAIVVLAMLAGLSASIWTPQSDFGQWVSNDQGRFAFMGIVFAILVAGSLLMLAVLRLLLILGRALQKHK